MGKKNVNKKKEMSEGKTIMITVLLITGGIVGLIFALQFIVNSLFPGW